MFRDYIYNKKLTQANGQTTWRCADVLKLRCKAVVITKNGSFIDARRQHNHPSHASRIGQRQLYKVEEELEEYIEICTSNPKISQYLGSSNISIMTAKDGKECKLFLPASEATEIEMQALVDAAEVEEEEEEAEAEVQRALERDREREARWQEEEDKRRGVLRIKHLSST